MLNLLLELLPFREQFDKNCCMINKQRKRDLFIFISEFSEEPKQSQDSAPSQTGQFDRSTGFPRTGLTPPTHGFYGHTFGALPYMPYSGNFLSNGAYPSPLLHSTATFPQSSLFRPMSTPALNTATELNTAPLSQRLSQSYTAPTETLATNFEKDQNLNGASKDTSGSSGATGEHMPPERSGEQIMGSSSNLSGSRAFLPNYRSPLHTSVLPDPFIPNFSPRLNSAGASNYGTEYSRHIMSLLNEIDSQRTEKKKVTCMLNILNTLPNDKIFDLSKFRAFAENKINVAKSLNFVLEIIKNMLGKGEYVDN